MRRRELERAAGSVLLETAGADCQAGRSLRFIGAGELKWRARHVAVVDTSTHWILSACAVILRGRSSSTNSDQGPIGPNVR